MGPPRPPSPPAPVTIATAPPKETRLNLDGTEVHDLASKLNGRSYQIVVGPPCKPEPGKKFATIYVLDGYWDFPLVNAMRGALHYDGAIPDVMIIEGERHAAVKNEAYNRGLRYVLSPLAPNPSK